MKSIKAWKGFIAILLVGMSLLPFCSVSYVEGNGEHSSEELIELIEGIIDWKKSDVGIDTGDSLLNNVFLEHAGETVGDWYPVGIGRIGYQDDYDAYLAVINDVVSERYLGKDKLDGTKATEWHRISLAILAMGGDPTRIGEDADGNVVNLIRDGVYNRGNTASLGAQGINGWIWGLIALDSMRYKIPEDSYYSRDDIITEILKLQLEDGGFSFYHDSADPDMTGMALQALAPYYNSEQTYAYERKSTGERTVSTVRQVVDGALAKLSEMQFEDGGFASWGSENVESTVQVLVALTALGKDPVTDERFIKNGNTLLDGIMKYRSEDGGFIHSKVYNPDNPTSLPDASNTMASEQVLYALVALYRYEEGYRSLYDFRPEFMPDVKSRIASVEKSIRDLPEKVSLKDAKRVQTIFTEYKRIPVSERSYVFHYYRLADAMKALGIHNTSEPLAEGIGITENGKGAVTPLFDSTLDFTGHALFTEDDAERVESLPEKVTTKHYVEVVKLTEKLEKSENREDYAGMFAKLKAKKKKIEDIKVEIASLNNEILDKLYPFTELSIKDKRHVDEIAARFEKLSDDDQRKILNYEDVRKSKTQVDNLIRARVIAVGLAVLAVIVAATMIVHIRKRKRKKARQQMFLDDESQ